MTNDPLSVYTIDKFCHLNPIISEISIQSKPYFEFWSH